ncbi:sphingosine n-acyltransferase lag1 [Acrodontium crateriforme]|uniref:Sphingosine n-acyltransferase lag1 n=1 Tax=Acrodontium crateriforme TaxID=150365 RepID=A0AAQ3R5D3_9PEZI|nr:sphingosine n-acyltransferase lag1 [Acrodontium crateriforme]
MSSPSGKEAFPPLTPSSGVSRNPHSPSITIRARPRRKSSNLGADPRGDTGATSLATSSFARDVHSPPRTPIDAKSSERPVRERKRKKAKKLFNRWKRMSLRHTWINPLILVLLILGGYYVSPGEHNPLHSAIFLSYPNPPMNERTNTLPAHIGHVTQYGKGPKDFGFFGFYTIVLSFSREFLMQRLIQPIAVMSGIRSRAKQLRFMEQFYTAIYFAIFGPFGLFVMSRTPVWYFNTTGMYEGFPHRAHESYFKAYYLLQAAYWAQQSLVMILGLEARRKDFRELVLHHLITLSLIGLSYRFHFTYMGIAVYITHDISDFFLATSKVLNYLDSILIGPYFAFFIGVWAYLRHYINLSILRSLVPAVVGKFVNQALPPSVLPAGGFHTGEFETVGPFELNWETQQYKCWIAQIITFALLAALQAVNIFWFLLILRILYRFLFKGVQKDERSEDEEEEEVPTLAVDPKSNVVMSKPQVQLNGEPVHAINTDDVPVSGYELRSRQSTRKR